MPGSVLPARGASLSEFGVRAGMVQQESAFSARHGRRESARGRIRRPGAARGFALPGHGRVHHQLWLPVWLPGCSL